MKSNYSIGICFSILVFILFFWGCERKQQTSSENYHIKGSIKNFEPAEWVWLEKNIDGKFVRTDSAKITNGIFELEGPVTFSDACLLNIANQKKYPFIIHKEFTELQADAKAKSLTLIKASKDNIVLQKIVSVEAQFTEQATMLRQKYEQAGQNSLKAVQDSIVTVFDTLQNRYVRTLAYTADTLPPSLVHAYILFNLDIKTYLEIWKNKISELKLRYPKVSLVKQAAQQLVKSEKVNTGLGVGAAAPEINLSSPKGDKIALSSLKGNFVLIDFWASWCGPCRAENPNVVSLYKKYGPKGLKIYGVSLDNNKEKWLKAIETDKLSWLHVSDLKGWQSDAATTYSIESIPATLLLDKDGKILARNLRGQELYDKIAQLYK